MSYVMYMYMYASCTMHQLAQYNRIAKRRQASALCGTTEHSTHDVNCHMHWAVVEHKNVERFAEMCQ